MVNDTYTLLVPRSSGLYANLRNKRACSIIFFIISKHKSSSSLGCSKVKTILHLLPLQRVTYRVNLQASAEHFDHGENTDGFTNWSSQFDLQQLLASSCGLRCVKIHMFLRLLAVRLSTSCVSKVLAGKPQKHDILTSCGGLRVLTAQELLAALLARALLLCCTELFHIIICLIY